VAAIANLPANAAQGDAYLVQADDSLRVWDSVSSSWVNLATCAMVTRSPER
jgi:hypothetical protein